MCKHPGRTGGLVALWVTTAPAVPPGLPWVPRALATGPWYRPSPSLGAPRPRPCPPAVLGAHTQVPHPHHSGAVSWVDSGPHHEPAHRPAPAPAPAGAGPAPRAPEGATWWQHLHMRRPGGRQLLPWRAPPGQGDLWGLGPVGVPLPPKEPRPGVARRDDGRARRLSSAGRPGRDTRNQNRAEAWGRFRSSHLSAFQAA